jgi:hypothetical protein
MTWIIFVLAIVGVVLNIRKHWSCFAIWLITNGFWAVHNLLIGQYAQAVLFGVYFGLSIYGLLAWKHTSELDKAKDELIRGSVINPDGINEDDVAQLRSVFEARHKGASKHISLRPVESKAEPYGGKY